MRHAADDARIAEVRRCQALKRVRLRRDDARARPQPSSRPALASESLPPQYEAPRNPPCAECRPPCRAAAHCLLIDGGGQPSLPSMFVAAPKSSPHMLMMNRFRPARTVQATGVAGVL